MGASSGLRGLHATADETDIPEHVVPGKKVTHFMLMQPRLLFLVQNFEFRFEILRGRSSSNSTPFMRNILTQLHAIISNNTLHRTCLNSVDNGSGNSIERIAIGLILLQQRCKSISMLE